MEKLLVLKLCDEKISEGQRDVGYFWHLTEKKKNNSNIVAK